MSDKKKNEPSSLEKDKDKNMLGVSFDKTLPKPDVSEHEENVYGDTDKTLSPSPNTSSIEGVFDVESAFDNDNVEIGTIVSDKKRKRTSIIKSINSAFAEWWGKTRKSIDNTLEAVESKDDKPEVIEKPDNEDRTKIIKKATELTTRAPKDNHNVIIEKIRTLSKDAERINGVPYNINTPVKKEGLEKKRVHKKGKEVLKTKTKTAAPAKPAVAAKRVPKPKHVETPDLRKEMVAPVINTRLQKNIYTYEAPGVRKKEIHDEKPRPTKTKLKKKLPPIKPAPKSPEVTSDVFVAPKVTSHSSTELPQEDNRKNVPHAKLEWDDEPVSQRPETKPVPEIDPSLEPVVLEKQSNLLPKIPERSLPTQTSDVGAYNTTPPTLDAKIPKRTMGTTPTPQKTASSDKWNIVLRIFIIIIIIGVGVTLAVFSVTKFNIFEKNSDQTQPQDREQEKEEAQLVEPVYIPTFFDVDTQASIHITGSGKQFLSTLKYVVGSANTEVTQFYPVVENETVLQNLSTEKIFRILNTHLGKNPISVLEDVSMFGGVMTDRNEPYIVIRSYNFDTLFAGLLEWEPYMYDDLMPLFGESVLLSETFVDAIKDNASIRILYDENGNEVMLYAFINRSTVVITSSTEALSKIIERL